tara:strand:+ start:557 stop:1243 length:687 start_codon:yes stop_codon:yes gene_type:complete
MSFKSELSRGVGAIATAVVLAFLTVAGSDWMRNEGHWPTAVPASPDIAIAETLPAETILELPAVPAPTPTPTPTPAPAPAMDFESVLEAQLSWGTPILDVFALCHGRTQLETGDSEFRHSRVEGVDWLEYYESAALPGGEIAIRGFRAPMAALNARNADGILVVTADGAEIIGGAWHITSMGEIGDAIQLEPAPGLAIPACLDADAAAARLNAVLAGDHADIRARRRD